jgi:mannose-6-phosphate isomerase-like protein (cupin superfamily)
MEEHLLMSIINWRDCESYPVHGEATERALIGNQSEELNQGPKAPKLPAARGFVFFNHAVLDVDRVLEVHTGVFEEIYYVIRGSGTFVLDDTEFPVRDGDAVFVPEGVRHGMRNKGRVPIEYLVTASRG